MTNGDKIRSMNNKELTAIVRCPYSSCPYINYPIWNRECRICIENWLDKEVEVTNLEKIRKMPVEELSEFLEYSNSYLPNGLSWFEWLLKKEIIKDD